MNFHHSVPLTAITVHANICRYASISNEPLNPLTAISRIEAVRSELAGIVKRSAALESKKAMLTASLQAAIVENCQALESISTCGNIVFDQDDDDDLSCADFLPTCSSEQNYNSSQGGVAPTLGKQSTVAANAKGSSLTRSSKSGGGGSSCDLNARSIKIFSPVSEEEFNSVSYVYNHHWKI